MKKITSIILVMLAFGALAGCQDNSVQPASSEKNSTAATADQKDYVDHGLPHSEGPSTTPGNGVTPTTPPPENSAVDQAQAVTTNENIRLTLPRKSE